MSNNEAFDGQILADKLTKLNSSQQSIECILHKKSPIYYMLYLIYGVIIKFTRSNTCQQLRGRICFSVIVLRTWSLTYL